MGWAKHRHMEILERGFGEVEDKYVCDKCFDDEGMKDFIRGNAIKKMCSYCGRRSKKNIAAHIEEVFSHISSSLDHEWDDPANCLPYESREGGYLGETWDMIDLLQQIEFAGANNDNIIEEMQNAFDFDRLWCRRDPFSATLNEEMMWAWKDFCKQVKHKSRYVFFKMESEEKDESNSFRDEEASHLVLNGLSRLVIDTNLIDIVEVGSLFYRVRMDDKKRYKEVEQLGPPPEEYAIYSNRMSPSGIPMFYCSSSIKTALEEVNIPGRGGIASIGTFQSMQQMLILDLSKKVTIPSLFSESTRHLRGAIIFMKSFSDDICKPIKKDGREHTEYVPTQIVTEFFRYLFKDESGRVVNGIKYRSSKGAGESYVFFATQNNFVGGIRRPYSRESTQLFKLVKSSHRVIK